MKAGALASLIADGEPSDAIWQASVALSDELFRADQDINGRISFVFEETVSAISAATNPDTFSALATCLLEHLLEVRFSFMDRIERDIRNGNDKLLYALTICSKFGEAKLPQNAERLLALEKLYE
jgi:hypothetical protein